MKASTQTGSHVVALALFVVVLAAIGLTGYKVWQMNAARTATTTASTTATAPAAIQDSADLTQAAKFLDQSSAQLDNSLDDSALNADMNSML